jgi:hypothetical protein
MNHDRFPNWILLVVLLMLVSVMPTGVAEDPPSSSVSVEIQFSQPQGTHMMDIIHLNGSSNVPLRNASWSVVNISGSTPTTVISGPYLTAVMPLSEGRFAWNLTVDVPGLDCTCYVSIEMIDENGVLRHWDLLLYLGDTLHRPVMVGEWRQQFSHEMTAENGLQSLLLVSGQTDYEIELVLAPDSGSISMVSARVCEAPFGVCLDAPETQTVPHELVDSRLVVTLEPTNLTAEEGVWKVVFTATDSLLRTTGQHHLLIVYDISPPEVLLSVDQTTNEREPINVYANVDDGYTGAEFSYTWTLIDEQGMRRAPTDSEQLAPNHLLLNLSAQGQYTVEVSVRDLAGQNGEASSNFTVLNQRPTALISNDGMIFAEDGRLTVGENDGWSITGNLSYDDEPVEYLWVVNDDRSWRGLTSLNQEHFEEPGTYTIELIVFDNDGATHSAFLELEILAEHNDEPSSSNGWLGLLLLVFLLGIFVGLSRRTSSVDELPKWSAKGMTSVVEEPVRSIDKDATVEEDEARG